MKYTLVREVVHKGLRTDMNLVILFIGKIPKSKMVMFTDGSLTFSSCGGIKND